MTRDDGYEIRILWGVKPELEIHFDTFIDRVKNPDFTGAPFVVRDGTGRSIFRSQRHAHRLYILHVPPEVGQ